MEKNLLAPQPVPARTSLQHKLDFLIELILMLILTISPFLCGSVNIFPVTMIEIGAFLILFLWVIKCIKQGFFEFAKLPINKSIALFIIFILIQYFLITIFIPNVLLGEIYRQKMKKEILKLISYLIFFYVVLDNFHDRKRINRLIYIVVSIGFFLAFFGIIQKLSGTRNMFWISQVQCSEGSFASFPNRNHFASYINMIIFLALGGVFSQFPLLRDYIRGFDKESVLKGILATFQKGIWLYIFGLIVMVSGLFYSLSRGGIIAFLCGVIFFSLLILIKGLTKRGYLFLFIILISTFAMLAWINAPEQIMQRFSQTSKSKSLAEKIFKDRKIFLDTGIDLIKDYPLVGLGFGAFEFIYNKRYSSKFLLSDSQISLYIDYLHNDFLELFCEVGFVGFIIFFITACLYIFFIIKILHKRRDPFAVGIGVGAMASLFSMCVHGLFDFNFHITSNAILFFIIAGLGLVASASQIRDKKEISLLPRSRPIFIKGLFLKTLILVVSVSAFFYIAKIIINPYLAYKISIKEKLNLIDLKEAVRLDPSNDKYHFLLARFFVEEAKADTERAHRYAQLALNEVKEAIRLNPWNEYYPIYQDWIANTFKQ